MKWSLALVAGLPACGSSARPDEPVAASTQTLTVIAPLGIAAPVAPAGVPGCPLKGGKIQHVIYVQFDNVHYTRDNPNVPSDLEQQPNLLNFLTNNGTFLDQEHTPLIAHTADDILTSITGLYPSHQGQAVANAYGSFRSRLRARNSTVSRAPSSTGRTSSTRKPTPSTT